MREFANATFRLSTASWEVRLVYTGFLALVAIGLVTMAGMEALRVGVRPAAIAAHYRGGDMDQEMAFAKSAGRLMETAHFHAFIMAVVFLILAHLFLATGWSAAAKRAWIGVALAATACDLAGPWLVRYVAGSFAVALEAAWLGLAVGYGVMIAAALQEMWST